MNYKLDVMQVLAAARPARLDPDDRQARRAHDLAAVLAESGREPSQTPLAAASRRLRPRVALSAALAAAGALAVAAVATLAVTPNGLDRDGVQSGEAGGNEILLAAARQSAKEADGTGRYWRSKGVRLRCHQLGRVGDRYLVCNRTASTKWADTSVSGGFTLESQPAAGGPATPADDAAWRRNGAPDLSKYTRPDGPASVLKVANEPAFHIGGSAISVAELQALPADPGKLEKFLRSKHQPISGPRGSITVNPFLFDAGGALLGMPVKSAVRSAVYKMLANLRGVRGLGPVHDLDGRLGQGFAIRGGKGNENKLVIDPSTGRVLARELWVVLGRDDQSAAPKLVFYTLSRSRGWTNEPPPPATT